MRIKRRQQMQGIFLTLPNGNRVGLPTIDARIVPLQVMCDYLERDKHGVYALARSGKFSAPGCTVILGRRTFYVPCRIWAVNDWKLAPEVTEALSRQHRPDHRSDTPPLAFAAT